MHSSESWVCLPYLSLARHHARSLLGLLELTMGSLLTVGQTVDEAAWLFVSLDHACHAQLMAEAAAANGVPKKIIPDDVAQYTADAAQNPVRSLPRLAAEY